LVKIFQRKGSVAKLKSSDRPGTSEENVERIRQSCVKSPKEIFARRNLELGIPKKNYDSKQFLQEFTPLCLQGSADA
jgi:hypothetical protein